MKITFCLRNPKSTTPTPIHAFVHLHNRQLKLSTGYSVHPKNWNADRRRVRRGAADEGVINGVLAKMEADLVGIATKLEAMGIAPTPELIKEKYAALAGKREQTDKPVDLFTAYTTFIRDCGFRPTTKVSHTRALNHLTNFRDAYGLKLSLDRFSTPVWEKFARYLLKVRGLTNDSAWCVLKSVRAFFNDAASKGVPVCEDFLKVVRQNLPHGENSDKPYLTRTELDVVRSLDLSGDPRAERVRDLFVFLCYSGIRFGDSQSIKPENVVGSSLKIVTGKNRKAVTVPLLEPAREILAKYNGTLPVVRSHRRQMWLKDVLKLAGIDTPCHTVTHSGTERRERTVPKYELCGFHTGKRSFVSLSRERGVSVEALARVTGNSRQTLQRYIIRTDADAFQEIQAAWSESEEKQLVAERTQ